MVDVIIYIIVAVLGLFAAKLGVDKYAKKIAAAALEGRKYSKEVDGLLSDVATGFSDGVVDTADLKAIFTRATNIIDIAKGVNNATQSK